MRKRIEELFGEAKELMGFRRAKFRYHRFVREQVLMTAAVQNMKRMVRLLSRAPKRQVGVGRGAASSLDLRMNSCISLLWAGLGRGRLMGATLTAR
jgi:hypothetical protein